MYKGEGMRVFILHDITAKKKAEFNLEQTAVRFKNLLENSPTAIIILTLLLARAAAGPALVVAPTSVCGNWAEETARFAPGLRCSVYGQADGERAAQIEGAGAGDLLVVSYALLLRDAEAFGAKPWATLVLDEAQALKNAATQRVQAVAGLQAGFRLALTGTPVENRLADLWSIMNLLNPGLLGSAARFAERFDNPIERQRNEAARARLRRLVGPFLLRWR